MANVANLIQLPHVRPDFIVHGAEATAPAAAAVLADTGVIAVATSLLVLVNFSGDDAVATLEIARRNAANGADVQVDYFGVAGSLPNSYATWFSVAAGERIVARAKTAGTAAMVYQASLFAWILP
jgi:hypothetical protein